MAFLDFAKRYYMTMIMVSIFLLIYILNFINTAYNITTVDKKATFPPWISPCPDYWSNVSTDSKTICHRLKGNNNGPETYTPSDVNVTAGLGYDFTKETSGVEFTDVSLYEKCLWSKDSGVFWEGITDNACSSFPNPSSTN